jgi:PAS domain S-box-containing protein
VRIDGRTAIFVIVCLWIGFSALSVAVWWTRRRYAGFGRFTIAGPAIVLATLIMGLRGSAPDWLTSVCANGLFLSASVLYLNGARAFRGLPLARWPIPAGVATIGAVAFFTYAAPSLNGRAASMSAFLAVLFLLTAIPLIQAAPPGQRLGLWLLGGSFALGAATHAARAAWFTLGPAISDSEAFSGVSGLFVAAVGAEMAVLPLGFMLAVHERMLSDLSDAAAVRDSERLFRTMANAAPVMIWMTGTDKHCTYVNHGWLEFTGRALETQLGDGWSDGIHAEDREACLTRYREAFDRREPCRLDYRLLRHDGEYRWVFDQGVPRFGAGGEFAGYVGSAIDVTERKLAEEATTAVSRRLIAAQEEERSRIARELHDDVVQQLAVMKIDLDWITKRADGPVAAVAEEAAQSAVSAAESLRNLTHSLHPAGVPIRGLVPSLERLASELPHSGPRATFTHDRVPDAIQETVATAVYRIAQEALHNAAKHSQAGAVSVHLRGGPNHLRLTVSDDGVGFVMDAEHRARGLGLVSMRERVEAIGGTLMIQSSPGRGTRLDVTIPLSKPDHRSQTTVA